MKRLKFGFAVLLLLLGLPAWRLIDWAVVTIPYASLFTVLMVGWGLIYLALPLKILLKKKYLFLIIASIVGSLSWLTSPLSNQTTARPALNHCGGASYTGFFYPFREYLSNVHHDDLEARNQICWLVKMSKEAPDMILSEDFQLQLEIVKKKLLKPANKYRSSMPWIVFLYGTYLSAKENGKSTLESIYTSKNLMDEAHFWHDLYSEEISSREYSALDWPHSFYIKQEYGFIERNWNKIAISIR